MRARTHVSAEVGSHAPPKVRRQRVVTRSGCGKWAYASKKEAKAKARASSKMSGEHIEAYHCTSCHCWHIGHPPGSRTR